MKNTKGKQTLSEQSTQPESRMDTKEKGIVSKKHKKKGKLVALTLEELLNMDFGNKPKYRIYQRPKDAYPDEGVFWDTYLHPGCVEVDPPERKIYQRPLDAYPDEGIFWDTYLHPRCVEMTPKDWRSTK